MKRLIACLTAVILLCVPVLSTAEAVRTTIMLETDQDRLIPLITQLSDAGAESLASGIAEFLNDLVLRITWQEDAVEAVFTLKDETIFTIAGAEAGEVLELSSNLTPGYVLTTSSVEKVSKAQLEEDIAAMDLAAAWEEILWCVETFMVSADYTEETGSFVGDAYQNGVRRQTLCLDDRDLSLLMDCALTSIEWDPGVEALLTHLGMDAAEVVFDARLALQDAALLNAYSYQVSAVYDAEDKLIGLSGTALQQGKQIATLSIGLNNDYTEIVWGYGYGGVNYYIRGIVLQESGQDGSISVSALVDVFADPTGVGYNLAASMDACKLESNVLMVALIPAEDGVTFEAGAQSTTGGSDPVETTVTLSGQQTDGQLDMSAALYMNDTEEPALLLHVDSEICENITIDFSGKKALDMDTMTEEEAAILDSEIEDAAAELGVKLFKLMPAELMLLLMQ